MTLPGDDLACIELVELVTAYLDDALAPAERARLEAHLADCEGCAVYVEQIRQTIALAGRLVPEVVPAPMMERLLAAFRASRTDRPAG